MSLKLASPHVPIVEFYLDDGWRDVTSDVRLDPPIEISQGRSDEQADLEPSTCTFVLTDTDGDYSPRNPIGQWFGSFGRNTLTRVALDLGSDDFQRTAATGWGVSPDNGEWFFLTNGTAAPSVTPGAATHSITTTGTYAINYISAINTKIYDVDVVVTVDIDVPAVSGAPLEPANVMLRFQQTGEYLMLRTEIQTDHSLRLYWFTESGTWGGSVTPALTWTGEPLRIRAQASGHTLRGKIWLASDPEPLDWDITRNTDISFVNVSALTSGTVAIRSGVASGNTNTKPVVFRYSDLQISSPRFTGEIASVTPYTDETHQNRFAQIEASGVTRRLLQGKAILGSSIRRFYERSGDIRFYYPLDGGENSLGSPARVGEGMASFDFSDVTEDVELTPRGYLGKGSLSWWLGRSVQLSKNVHLNAPIGLVSGGWRFDFVVAYNGGINDNGDVDTVAIVGDADRWYLEFNSLTATVTLYRQASGASSPTSVASTTSATNIFDGAPHHIIIGVEQSGSNAEYDFRLDGIQYMTGTTVYVMQSAKHVELTVVGSDARSFGHLALYPAGFYTDAASAVEAAFGHSDTNCNYDAGCLVGSEGPYQRIERLCDEEVIDVTAISGYDIQNDDAETPYGMGPQGQETLIDLFTQCEDVDQGTLYESRAVSGYVYRRYDSLLNQAAWLTLDYARGDVAPTLEATFDDQLTRNRVTGERIEGASATVEQTSGPLGTEPPPTGVGVYDDSIDLNVATDNQVADIAGWLVALGTVDEDRYANVRVIVDVLDGLTATKAIDVNVGDRLAIENVTDRHVYETVEQVVRGYTEIIGEFVYEIAYNCTPASPYDVIKLEEDGYSRLDDEDTVLDEDLTTTETDVTVDVLDTSWTTTDEPFDVVVSGERMTVTNVTGNVFTVIRSVNGVVKTHASGTQVRLADPLRLAASHVEGTFE